MSRTLVASAHRVRRTLASMHFLRWLRPRRYWRLPIATYLGLGTGGLTFIALASVLLVTLWANWQNTTELLRDKSRLLIGSLVEHTRRQLDPAVAEVNFLGRLLERGEVDPADHARLFNLLGAALAGNSLIEAMLFFDAGGVRLLAARAGGAGQRGTETIQDVVSWRGNHPATARSIAEASARETNEPYWGPPVFVEQVGPLLNLRRPVRRDGRFVGLLVASIPIRGLSAFIAGLETELGQNAFILYDRDYVLAHRALQNDFPGLSAERPLPKVTEIGDPILFNIWRPGWEERNLLAGSGHSDEVGGRDYVYLYSPVADYGESGWLIGSYFAANIIGVPFIRLVRAGLIGVLGLALALACAVLMGRALRSPVDRLAAAAASVRELDLEHVPVLERSRFRELDEAIRAFNAMVTALQAFALYVPRDLVMRLIARGDLGALRSQAREVTVLFSDIAGFTTRTEHLSAEETAAFLNEHFRLVTKCIEAEGGMIDKFIGDAVMAVWGAVEDQPDHPARAVLAARAIAAALRADNAAREHPVRLRIGLDSGPAVAGNIGNERRINYTVVGDTVNTAQRLQALAGELFPQAEVVVLASAASTRGLPPGISLHRLGAQHLRGRSEPIEVCQIEV